IHYLAFYLQADAIPVVNDSTDGLPRTSPNRFLGRSIIEARKQYAEKLARDELGLKEGLPKDPNDLARFLQTVTKYREQLEKEGWHQPAMAPEKVIDHAEKAVLAFHKAMTLDPKNGLYPLGLASLLEQFDDWNDVAKVTTLPTALNGHLQAEARKYYFLAW